MTYIVGIDPSSRYVAITARDTVLRTMSINKYDIREGLAKNSRYMPLIAANTMDAMIAALEHAPKGGDKRAYLEEPVIGRGGARTSIVQAYVNGVIQAVLLKSGFDVELVHVAVWKRTVCGSGSADKNRVRQALAAQWPKASRLSEGDQDKVDSAAICLHGYIITTRVDRVEAGDFSVQTPN